MIWWATWAALAALLWRVAVENGAAERVLDVAATCVESARSWLGDDATTVTVGVTVAFVAGGVATRSAWAILVGTGAACVAERSARRDRADAMSGVTAAIESVRHEALVVAVGAEVRKIRADLGIVEQRLVETLDEVVDEILNTP